MQTRDLDRIRFVTRHFHDLQGLRYWVPLGLVTLSVGGTTYFSKAPWMLLRAGLFLSAFLLWLGARRYYTKAFGEVESQIATPEPYSVSIYSPAGPLSPLAGFQQVPPMARHFLVTLGLAFALFSVFQAMTPNIMVLVNESLFQPPWATLDAVFLTNEPWTRGTFAIVQQRHIIDFRVLFAQTTYALYGAFFLGLWLWRGRRLSQSYHLAFAITLLGLAVFGTCLGYLVWEDRNLPRFAIDLFLPAVVHLWVALLLCGSSMILAGLLDHWQLVRALGRRMEA